MEKRRYKYTRTVIYNNTAAYFAIVFVVGVLAGAWLFQECFLIGLVSSDSMEPSYMMGDVMIMRRSDSDIKAKDVIAFERDGRILVKRVIATGGQSVYISSGGVFVDRVLLTEPYAVGNAAQSQICEYDVPMEFDVPIGTVFVLGDNRERSIDSRCWSEPFVPLRSIVAKRH